mmetsp:Transcript_4255/g.8473  ORF Transcript_4255/g.8473 Transcript_4255/m.8473 type:complete len:174 (-) Transcript_4255:3728-4249(-)
MGKSISMLSERLFNWPKPYLVMVGPDNAGKTTLLELLEKAEDEEVAPVYGFAMETVELRHCSVVVWDLAANERARPLLKHYYENCRGVVLVIDACDRSRFKEVRRELDLMISDDDLAAKPFLILANKQDLPDPIPVEAIIEELNLNSISSLWHLGGIHTGAVNKFIQHHSFLT